MFGEATRVDLRWEHAQTPSGSILGIGRASLNPILSKENRDVDCDGGHLSENRDLKI